MQQNSAKKASIYLGVFLAVVMIAGVFLPYLNQSATTTTTDVQPTDTVVATFPPPPSNLDAITFDKAYLHPSGVFSIGDPDGWDPSQPNMGPGIAQINLTNNDALSVVDTYIEDTPITTDQLSNHFSESVIAASWSNFTTWQESSRQMQGDKLIIDFTVTLTGRTFVARQEAWTDGQWIYVVRVLVPDNATDLLRYLLDNFVKSFAPQTEFEGSPLDWNGFYDPDSSHIIRYPSDWKITDSAAGRPTSISSGEGIFLRVETRDNTSVADQNAATTLVSGLRSGVKIVSVKPVTRLLGQGFSVAYSYPTVDGSQQSGLTVLLNGPDDKLHIADLVFPASGVDLNQVVLSVPPSANATAEATAAATPEATPESTAQANDQTYVLLAQVMDTFYVIQPLNLIVQATPTPTVEPTEAVVSTEESGVLNFGAVTEAATAAVTAPAAAPTSAATPEATAVPTTAVPTTAPTTAVPTTVPTTAAPTKAPTTAAPSATATSTATATPTSGS
ncbi:MAG TPA: hypothetical protein VHD90_12080 [Phototrophicaceae bacterium]|nr:hypothetical protein [Phototrophicaceae bacterium]